jgi:hypothetical protein
MAQAVSVPSSTRQLITGENPHQSTNLSAVGVQALHRHYFIGGSGAVIVSTGDVGLLRLSQDRRGDVKLENRRWYAANAGEEPRSRTIGAFSYETAGFLLGRLLRNALFLLRFRSRNRHLQLSAFDGVSSKILVRSKPQGRLK